MVFFFPISPPHGITDWRKLDTKTTCIFNSKWEKTQTPKCCNITKEDEEKPEARKQSLDRRSFLAVAHVHQEAVPRSRGTKRD